MAVLEEISQTVRDAAERIGPAVVGLGRGWGRGSGVVVAPGTLVTNAHNLRGDEATVTFADGRREAGAVAGVDAGSPGDGAGIEKGAVFGAAAGGPVARVDDLEPLLGGGELVLTVVRGAD